MSVIPILATTGTTLSGALENFGTVMSQITETITDNTILFTMFAGGLMVVGAKVFKRIKNSVK